MNAARLNSRWHGHQIGTTVYGKEADRAIEAGRADAVKLPKAKKIRTGATATSPTRRPTEEHDDDNGADTG